MKPIPETEHSLVLRTTFADESAWQSTCAAIEAPVGEFQAYVTFLSDRQYDGLDPEQMVELTRDGNRTFIFVVDQQCLSHPDRPILVVDVYAQPGRSFRVIPSEMWSVENNLSLANMDFEEFADAVDQDGIFRGFPET